MGAGVEDGTGAVAVAEGVTGAGAGNGAVSSAISFSMRTAFGLPEHPLMPRSLQSATNSTSVFLE